MTVERRAQPFDRISLRYRLVNRIISFGLDRGWRRIGVTALQLSPGMVVLDIGCGAGEMLEAMPKCVVKIGIDPAYSMLRLAKAFFHGLRGAGEMLPLRNASVDRVTSAFVLRNLRDRMTTFIEIKRVLKPRGVGAIMDFSPPESDIWGKVALLYIRLGIPLIGRVVTGDAEDYRYLSETILDFPSPETITGEMIQAGLTDVRYRRLMGGVNILYTFRKAGG